MTNDALAPSRRERGFSLIELLIVVMIIAVMAVVALPNIAQYVRNYKIKGAAQEVAGELQAARNKAVMTNTEDGVSFVVVDADSYRYVQEDMLPDIGAGTLPADSEKAPLRELPSGIRFVVATATDSSPSLRFLRLGGFCNPAAGGSCNATVASVCTPSEAARCGWEAGSDYLAPAADGTMVLTLLEMQTNLQRTIRIAPGGRVLPQP